MHLIRRRTPPGRLRPRRRRSGLTLLETVLALAVGGIAVALATQALQQQSQEIKAQIAGAQFAVVQRAADAYLSDNFATIRVGLPTDGTARILDGDGDGDSVDDLVDQGYLPDGWGTGATGSPYGHDYQVWMRYLADPGGDPTRAGVEAFVVTTGARDVLPTLTATAALSIGGSAGFVNNVEDPGTVLGLYGSWAVPVADIRPPSVGTDPVHLAYTMTFTPDTHCGEELYRVDVPGCPRSNVVENVTTVFENQLGFHVKNNALIEGKTRVDGLLVVSSYLEKTQPPFGCPSTLGSNPTFDGSPVCSGNTVRVPSVMHGNVFHFTVRGNKRFRLPEYVTAQTAAGVSDTVNSLTLVVRVPGGSSLNNISFADHTNNTNAIEWGFGETGPGDHCVNGGHRMMYQFLKFARTGRWLGQMVWKSCD